MQDAPETSAARCEATIAAFKDGSKSRITTTLALHDILSEPAETSPGHAGPIPTPEEVESYMELYEDMCDQWVRDQKTLRVSSPSCRHRPIGVMVRITWKLGPAGFDLYNFVSFHNFNPTFSTSFKKRACMPVPFNSGRMWSQL
jgi:hypothetical protein